MAIRTGLPPLSLVHDPMPREHAQVHERDRLQFLKLDEQFCWERRGKTYYFPLLSLGCLWNWFQPVSGGTCGHSRPNSSGTRRDGSPLKRFDRSGRKICSVSERHADRERIRTQRADDPRDPFIAIHWRQERPVFGTSATAKTFWR